MKKVAYVFILLVVLFVGIGLGEDTTQTKAGIIQDKTKDFEQEIIKPNNGYKNSTDDSTGSINNKIAKAGGSIIEEIFDFSFGLLEDLLG